MRSRVVVISNVRRKGMESVPQCEMEVCIWPVLGYTIFWK